MQNQQTSENQVQELKSQLSKLEVLRENAQLVQAATIDAKVKADKATKLLLKKNSRKNRLIAIVLLSLDIFDKLGKAGIVAEISTTLGLGLVVANILAFAGVMAAFYAAHFAIFTAVPTVYSTVKDLAIRAWKAITYKPKDYYAEELAEANRKLTKQVIKLGGIKQIGNIVAILDQAARSAVPQRFDAKGKLEAMPSEDTELTAILWKQKALKDLQKQPLRVIQDFEKMDITPAVVKYST